MSEISAANALLMKLVKGGRTIEASERVEAEQLVSEGLAQWKVSKKGELLALTDTGLEEKALIKKQQNLIAKQQKKPKTPVAKAARPQPLTLDSLSVWGESFKKELLDALAKQSTNGADPEEAVLVAQLVATVKALSPAYRRLVPIPIIRKQFPGVSAAGLNRALLSLEEDRIVDLKIANDPTTVANPEAGIRIADRGLLYFAIAP